MRKIRRIRRKRAACDAIRAFDSRVAGKHRCFPATRLSEPQDDGILRSRIRTPAQMYVLMSLAISM